MKTYRLAERVTVMREYIIEAKSEDDALDEKNSGEYEPTETEGKRGGGGQSGNCNCTDSVAGESGSGF